ncbi:shikimate dehydrogenase [Reinekea blandensis]|uniref:Shikimate dehydrogenase (NADP(+)) n=1 Tax=Reinekea blandensis MED297 TaxID=314283 RepID=A4B9U5_9GAMM|nr:shikimate dehydrogenase [Reinekea blandensis]EAR11396.1 shikimate 5-dehydrogenase [Reinekea sp. MED297] [Reinekea blandensis MED297]
MDRYAVIGHPITHSLSPKIHTLFAEQTGETLEYEGIELPITSFETRVWQLFKDGYAGFNVTVPFKGDAFDFVDEMSERAKRARAVNTLMRLEDGRIYGDTTDGIGLIRDFTENLNWPIENQHILILGAGGAVRGVLDPLLEQNPASLVIANRTLKKVEELADDFPELTPCTFEELSGQFDIIINGTSASLSGQVPPLPPGLVNAGTKCYDMMYSKEPTAFMAWAKEQGAEHCADGLGMLVGQAAESFTIWRGVTPQTDSVIRDLRAGLRG